MSRELTYLYMGRPTKYWAALQARVVALEVQAHNRNECVTDLEAKVEALEKVMEAAQAVVIKQRHMINQLTPVALAIDVLAAALEGE